MKNLKKVLAMVLAFACTFTMFASAKMYEDVQPGTEFSEAITMLSDLGIIQGKTDNKYHPEDTITRAEACALIARLMTGDPNAAGFNGAHHFKDVPAGHWASSAIGYAVVNGIAVGVDQAGTKFEPNRPIKDKEFVTMIVRALGYETPDMRQNFPFSYMSAANAIGLLQDVNMVPDTDALRGEDAQVIYNAMFVDYARGAKRVNVAHGTSVESYPTLAESVWHLNRAALGTWNKKDNEDVTLSNCKAHTWVILGEAQDEENALLALAIDDNEDTDLYKAEDKKHEYKAYKFKYEGTADIDALRGYKVELWGAGKHGEPVWEKDGEKFVYSNDWKIKAIKTVKNQTKFDYNPSMADRKSKDGSIELNEETKLSLGSAADNAKLVKQEQGVKEVVTFAADELNTIKVKDGDTLEEALNVRNGMQYKLIDWNNDKEIDWVVVDEARYYKVESATSKRVNVTSMAGDNLKSDKDSVTETWKLDESEKIGKNLADKDVKIKYEAPEGLKEGDIVEVTYKVAYDGAQVITATVKVVDAENEKLEKVATRDGLTLTFGDKEVKIAQNARKDGGDVIVPANPEKYAGFNGEELGTEFALTKNRNGFIVYSDYATEDSNYMMVLNTAGGKDTTGDRDLAVIDFVDAENKEHKDVKVSSSVRVLDKGGDTLTGAYKDRQFDEAKVVGNVFKYWTDADGVITKMQAMFDTKDTTSFKHADEYKYDADADRLIDVDGNNNYVASLEDAKVIFAVKHNYIREDLKTSKPVLGNDNLYVDSADVLATKQKDIPDIGTDPADVAMLGDALNTENAWLGNKDTKYKFAVQVDKNDDATAAVLGVENFNKFNAGQTKVALVTNVSENSKGIVEAEVAYNGEITTLASAEKQDFEDIVKVFDGRQDQDVAGTDARIDAPGNGVFDGQKLSEAVNQSGQYAEVTTDKDGKLTKVVFMDDDTAVANSKFENTNKLRGHHYTVSRNLVLKVEEKKLKYHLNDNQIYGDERAMQLYAGEDNKLQTVKRLPDQSAGYAEDAKFYQIDSAPTRHDKDYEGTRLTVNAGFNDIENTDVKVIEKMDVGASNFDKNSKKNVYEVADLAFDADGDLVAVYSFKKDMDQKDDYEYVAPANQYKIKVAEFAGRVKGAGNYVKTKNELYTMTGSNDKFAVYVGGEVVSTRAAETGVVGLTKDNFKVSFGINNNTQPKVEDVTAIKDQPGFYVLDLDMAVDIDRGVTVEVIANGNAVEVVSGGVKVEDARPELGENNVPSGEDTPAPEVPSVTGIKDITVKVGADKKELLVQAFEEKTEGDKKVLVPVTDLQQKDFIVKIGGKEIPVTVKPYDFSTKCYVVTSDNATDWSKVKDVTVKVGDREETLTTIATAASVEFKKNALTYETGSAATDTVELTTLVLKNLSVTDTFKVSATDLKLNDTVITADTTPNLEAINQAITVSDGKVYVTKALLDQIKDSKTLEFKLETGTAETGVTTTTNKFTVTASAPKATVSNGAYTLRSDELRITLTDPVPTDAVAQKLMDVENWQVKVAANSVFKNSKSQSEVKIKGITQDSKNKKVFVMQLDIPADMEYAAAGTIEMDNTLVFTDSDKTNPLTLTTSGKNITVYKIKLETASIKSATVDKKNSNKIVIKYDLGLTLDQAKELATEAKKGTVNDIFAGTDGKAANNVANANAVTEVVAEDADNGVLTLTLTNAYTDQKYVSIEFKGSTFYKPMSAVVAELSAN